MSERDAAERRPFYRSSTFFIFVALVLGVVLGGFLPQNEHREAYNFLRFLSRAFIALIKGLIAPLVFSTIVVGIAQAGDIKAVGRIGAKALVYFEVVTTLALVIGLFVANTLKPGAGLPLDLGATAASGSSKLAKSGWDIALSGFPSNLVKHAADADILPLVVFATLFGVGVTRVGHAGKPVLDFFDGVARAMFKYTDMVTRLTPIGVFGAMGFNVSHMASGHEVDGVRIEGWPAVAYLVGRYATLVGSLYLALVLLFVLVFVPIMLAMRIGVARFVGAIRVPLITAFSTTSSEAALPRLLEDVVEFGVPRRVAGLVIPAGYSFNLDGSTLYLALASLSIAQAAHIDLGVTTQVAMMFTFALASKGVAGVPRATLVIIAAGCEAFSLPGEAGMAMLLAVDELMDMPRTAINVFGNGLASVVMAKWERVFGAEEAQSQRMPTVQTAHQPSPPGA
jgi:Na+/H+-dicarboxylate symporter